MVFDLGCGDPGVPLLYCLPRVCAIFRQTKGILRAYFSRGPGAPPWACFPALADSAPFSLDHGGLDVRAAVYGLPAESWRSVSLGDVSLDRGRRADRVHSLSHHPCILLSGLLGDLAGSD